MRWSKRGLVFQPRGEGGWINSHAQVPTVLVLEDRLRIYVSCRPRPDLSLTTFVDVDRDHPGRVIAVHQVPVLEAGRPGTFDADGVMPSCVLRDGGRVLLYYSGWSRLAGKAPYNNGTGLAVSQDDGITFTRVFEGPILDRSPREPWSATSPLVLRHGGSWWMWYSSGTAWIEVDGKMEHQYVLMSAKSSDGIDWQRAGVPIVLPRQAEEAQTRPTILRRDGEWHMWFCHRGSRGFRQGQAAYRLGYATSADLMSWERDDALAGLDVAQSGWDSEMICYPCVVDLNDRAYLFYNGNHFGKYGFGYAVLEPDRL